MARHCFSWFSVFFFSRLILSLSFLYSSVSEALSTLSFSFLSELFFVHAKAGLALVSSAIHIFLRVRRIRRRKNTYGENSHVFMIGCQDSAAEFPYFEGHSLKYNFSLVHLSSNYKEDTITLSLSCTPFVTGYGGIFRRSQSRCYIKAVGIRAYARSKNLQ